MEGLEKFRIRLDKRISRSFLKSILLDQLVRSLVVYWKTSKVELDPPFSAIEKRVNREAQMIRFSKFGAEVRELGADNLSNETMNVLAQELENMSAYDLRMIALQRFTPSSLVGEECLPKMSELIEQCKQPFNEQEISVAARALMKHRSRDAFWGRITGTTEEKNRNALEKVMDILLNSTWWNQYYHFRHGMALEFRIETGHGARWGKEKFIGFVEPFFV